MKTILEIVGISAVLLLIAFIAIDRNKRDEGFIVEPQDRAGLVYEEDGIIHNYGPYEGERYELVSKCGYVYFDRNGTGHVVPDKPKEDKLPKSDIVFPKGVPEECFVFITDPNINKITMTIPNNVETIMLEKENVDRDEIVLETTPDSNDSLEIILRRN